MKNKIFRYFTFALCVVMFIQIGQFGVLAEETVKDEIVKDDGTIEEISPEDGTVDGGGDDTDNGESSILVTDKVVFGEHTYQVVLTEPAGTWESAKANAEAQGGHLATVTSQAEHDFLMTITGGRNLWIGGYRDDSYNWYWVTGEKWDYTNWAEGEPNDPEDPDEPSNPSKTKKKKKPNPPKQITIQRAKGIIKGYCKKNLRVFAIIKNKTYKTVANKKGRFKFNVPKIKVSVVRLYCKSKEGVKSKVVKARCNSMISKKDKK